MSEKLLQAAFSHYEAKKDEALAVLDVYLNNSAGIGEHSNLLEEILKWTTVLAEAEENIETLKRHF
tara:strand:+ start:570 stop:767 length:198 start_codon:yes stop_codon:yes gene_type:complete